MTSTCHNIIPGESLSVFLKPIRSAVVGVLYARPCMFVGSTSPHAGAPTNWPRKYLPTDILLETNRFRI